jgi:hypothetical protein
LIVDKFNVLPVNGLVIVLFLFQFKDVLDEELLKILVGVINAKLLVVKRYVCVCVWSRKKDELN